MDVINGVTELGGQGIQQIEGVGSGFFNFLQEQNLIELAVGFIIAINAVGVTNSFVDSFITPIINAVLGEKFEKSTYEVSGAKFEVGQFVTVLIKFFVIMFLIYIIFTYLLTGHEIHASSGGGGIGKLAGGVAGGLSGSKTKTGSKSSSSSKK